MADPAADPLALFNSDRQRARQAEDPMAHLCTVANTDAAQQPQLRTLVLRDVEDQLALFVNANSPKWPFLQETFALLTYWPSVQVQYRLRVRGLPLDADRVHESWLLRPPAPQRMDWYYEQFSRQSTAVSSRDTLLRELRDVVLPEPLQAPANARGLRLEPLEMERLDLNQPDGVHSRVRYNRGQNGWHSQVLVP